VIAEIELAIASRSGKIDAGEGVVTERTRKNLELERRETF